MSISVPDWYTYFRRQFEVLAVTHEFIEDAFRNYAVPILSKLMGQSQAGLFFDGKELQVLIEPYVPVQLSDTWPALSLKDYVRSYDYFRQYGMYLTTLVSIRPNWEVYDILGNEYCGGEENYEVCLLRRTPEMIYHLCVGKAPPPDADPQRLIAELLMSRDYVTCVKNAVDAAKVVVNVDLDTMVSMAVDAVQALLVMVEQYYEKLSKVVAAIVESRGMYALRALTGLVNRRYGGIFNMAPQEFISEFGKALDIVGGAIHSMSLAMAIRFVPPKP